MTGFCEQAWRGVGDWFAAITGHPFLTGLADGSLPEPVFDRYLLDDAHYLTGYSAALAALSSRAIDPDGRLLLARSAAGAVEGERQLHRGHLVPRGIDPDAPGAAEPSPTCVGYVESLRAAAALGPFAVGMAAVLPCFRVYAEVGAWIVAQRKPTAGHPYRDWIDTYADPAFAEIVRSAEDYTDRLAEAAGRLEQAAMLAAYTRSTRFEWMFWDAAWRGERWPEVD
ncbi:aminopyrimidine aminohydrolase [Microlunatus endophyticus]|uniref:Aminopyrimidine aminohydrolase n=1 Tax=Microlunatus endophyticus TaxID=1716077 RepID=A0A917SA93_9ACTN|nr:TenA family protein [Microlunatus endophyticus]GGL67466.1 aminopyrimidine aminohydrolase [Microlunatus endophyticus]